MIAYNLLCKDNSGQQPPPQYTKKTKKQTKRKPEEVIQPTINVEQKENEIKQNASSILLEEYNNTVIPSTIIQESDTESEREQDVKDDDLLN